MSFTPDRCIFERKTTYLSEYTANEECRRLEREGDPSARGMHPYRCPHYPPPSHWHIGHPYKSRLQRLQQKGVESAS